MKRLLPLAVWAAPPALNVTAAEPDIALPQS